MVTENRDTHLNMAPERHIKTVEDHLEVVAKLISIRDSNANPKYSEDELNGIYREVEETSGDAAAAMKSLALVCPNTFASRLKAKQWLYRSAFPNTEEGLRKKLLHNLNAIVDYYDTLLRLPKKLTDCDISLPELMDHISEQYRESMEALFGSVSCERTYNMLLALGCHAKRVNGGTLEYFAQLLTEPNVSQRLTNPKHDLYDERTLLIDQIAYAIEHAEDMVEYLRKF